MMGSLPADRAPASIGPDSVLSARNIKENNPVAPFQVMARVTAQADILDANIQVGLQMPIQLHSTADSHVWECTVQTGEHGTLLFTVQIQCQFPGIVWNVALTKHGDDTPRYQTKPHGPPVGITDERGNGVDSGLIDFN